MRYRYRCHEQDLIPGTIVEDRNGRRKVVISRSGARVFWAASPWKVPNYRKKGNCEAVFMAQLCRLIHRGNPTGTNLRR